MGSILVAGGAGYIGSHTTALLAEKGIDAVVLDDLRTGHVQAIKGARRVYIGDLRDDALLERIFTENEIEAVIDFAAYSLIGESIAEPLKYYSNNVAGAQSLLTAMKEHAVKRIVFSSTAAVYDGSGRYPLEETDCTVPTSPYGASKLAVEEMLKWCDQAYGIRYAILRYFNAAGADPDSGLGEDHMPETHLIPLVMKTALGQCSHVSIFGSDYLTADGTCVRDYIHVRDLAEAHLLALEHLKRTGKSDIFNLGSGRGYSVREVITAACRITGREIPIRTEARRIGDPAVLVASARKAADQLGWTPKRDLERMLTDAWAWHSAHPNGYEKR